MLELRAIIAVDRIGWPCSAESRRLVGQPGGLVPSSEEVAGPCHGFLPLRHRKRSSHAGHCPGLTVDSSAQTAQATSTPAKFAPNKDPR
jgi:hypothetical protein